MTGGVNMPPKPIPSIQPYPGTPGGRPKDKTATEERAAILLHVRRMVKGEVPDDTDVYINGTKLIEWLVKRGKK